MKTYIVKKGRKKITVQAETKEEAEQGYYIYNELQDIVNGKK